MAFPSHIINGSLCYIVQDERVLLLQRANPPHAGLWSAPGGKAEHGESPYDTVIREVFEETGLHIDAPKLIAIQTSVDVAYPVHWMLFIYLVQNFSGDLIQTSEGLLSWHNIAAVPSLPRPYPDTLYWPYVTEERSGVWQGKVVYNTPENLVEEAVYGD